MKKILLLLMLIATINVSYAQRKQVTDDYSMYLVPDATDFPPMNGTHSYGYVVNDDGDHVYDGAYSINCELPYTDFSEKRSANRISRNLKASGSFSVNTNFTKGILNGAYKSSRKVDVDLSCSYYGESLKINMEGSFTGAFLNGDPNGAFNINLKMTQNGRSDTNYLVANYNKGILVGNFSYYYDGEKYSGTLTQDGKLTGTWNINGNSDIFQNGVLISRTRGKKSTKPAIAEISRKYASGSIGESDLFEQGYMISIDKLNIGECVPELIMEFFKCDAIASSDFKQKSVYYQYLVEIQKLTDSDVEAVIEYICNYYSTGDTHGSNSPIYTYSVSSADKHMCIKVDQDNHYYVHMNNSNGGGYYNAYLSEQQVKYIDEKVNAHIKNNCAISLYEFIIALDGDNFKTLKSYLDGNKHVFNIYTTTEILQILDVYHELYGGIIQNYKANRTSIAEIEDCSIWQGVFIVDSSVEELEDIVKQIKSESTRIRIEGVKKAINWVKEKKKAAAIYWASDRDSYFYTTSNSPYWAVELEENLKPFSPFYDIEIVDITEDSAVIKIKKEAKKKQIITYQLSILHKDGKIHAESISMDKATIVE